MRTSQHPMIRFRMATLAGALILSACNCDRPVDTKGAHPDLVANPAALSFAACPTQDENGQPVADVFPDQQTVKLQNLGNSAATLTYEIRGAAKDQFTLVAESQIDSLASGDDAEIKVQFSPLKSGDASAELVIEDGDDTTQPAVIALVGTGSSLPAQPTIEISYEDIGGEMTKCIEDVNGQISNCLVQWPGTFIDQTATLNLKIANLGCPSLKISDLSLQPLGGATTAQFVVEEPAVPPTADAPLVLSVADGTQETNVRIRFEPRDDGTGNGQRYALLNVTTNSPKSPSQLSLFGYATQPAIYVTPTYCDYTDSHAGACGGTLVTTSGNNKASIFKVWNGGNSPVIIDSVALRAPNSGRFQVGAQNPLNKTIDVGASEDLEVQYTDDPVYVTDLLDISAHAEGQEPGMAGRTTVRLSGGVLPCLTVDPAQQLSFTGAATNPASLPVKVCDCATGGVLNISRFQVVQGATFFAVKTPPAKLSLAAGECTEAEIQFTKPVTGGLQTGTLEIASNDPDYAAPSFFRLNLYSSAPLNQVPVAVLEGPNGQQNSFSVDLSTLNPKKITIDGSKSYDPPQNDAPTSYTWYVDHTPYGAQGVIIETFANPGVDVSGQKITDDHVVLVMDPSIIGEYRVALVVEDATGQKSAAEILRILANE